MNDAEKLSEFQTLISEASAAMADLAEAFKARRDDETASALADIASALEKRKPADLAPIVEAIRALREQPPTVNLKVLPAPVQFLPAPEPDASWHIRVHGLHGAPDREMTIIKTGRSKA